MSNEEEIVVTAQKREERLQDVPISIEVLDGELLDRQPSGGSLEALASVPSVSQATSDAGGMTQVSIRGVSPTVPFGGGSPTVGYYIDSIPFGLVNSAAVPNTNAYDMSRMEVLRGPQGTLYGASALNGVVRILTNDADLNEFEFKARAGVSTTEGASDLNYRTDAAVNIPLVNDRLAIRLVGGVENQSGWISQPARGVEDANSSESTNLRFKLAARPTDNLRIDLGVWYSLDEYDAAPYADDAGNQTTPLAQPGETEYTAYNARVTPRLAVHVDFQLDELSGFPSGRIHGRELSRTAGAPKPPSTLFRFAGGGVHAGVLVQLSRRRSMALVCRAILP
ncbi:MAG: TonB-dependent receptor plug domain-containing protein [Caulobacteraceae bacterium]|nr:TonB-dependent receptor plug domain-containing protein [Caulobacteraceae bacterium]